MSDGAVAREAVRDLVLPGFARAGIDASAARAWFTSRAIR
jgi:hypothetical protein